MCSTVQWPLTLWSPSPTSLWLLESTDYRTLSCPVIRSCSDFLTWPLADVNYTVLFPFLCCMLTVVKNNLITSFLGIWFRILLMVKVRWLSALTNPFVPLTCSFQLCLSSMVSPRSLKCHKSHHNLSYRIKTISSTIIIYRRFSCR